MGGRSSVHSSGMLVYYLQACEPCCAEGSRPYKARPSSGRRTELTRRPRTGETVAGEVLITLARRKPLPAVEVVVPHPAKHNFQHTEQRNDLARFTNDGH